MANITVRGEPQKQTQTQTQLAPSPFEPLRWMRTFFNWDPFQEMAPLLQGQRMEFIPDFEIKETKDGYLFRADVPGVKQNDLDVSVSGNRLTISGKRESEHEEKTDTYYACERSYGSFSRSFTLPEGADTNAVSADLRDGVLNVSIHKKAEVQPKKIDIKSQATSKPH
jgi:HSP20 family protein